MAGKSKATGEGLWAPCECSTVKAGFQCLTKSGKAGTGDGWAVVGHPGKAISARCCKALGLKRERTLTLDTVHDRKHTADAAQVAKVGEGTHKGLLTRSRLEGTSGKAQAAISAQRGGKVAKVATPQAKSPRRKRPAAKTA